MRSPARRSATQGKQPGEHGCAETSASPTRPICPRATAGSSSARTAALPGPPPVAAPEPQERMKLLISSTDLEDLERVVKRLVWACIPCAVCKDPGGSHLSVWIQQDLDFPLALKLFLDRQKPRSLPRWACALGSPVPATETSAVPGPGRINVLGVVLVQPFGATRTGSAGAATLTRWPCFARQDPLRHPQRAAQSAGPNARSPESACAGL
jgi:hypothetical protein